MEDLHLEGQQFLEGVTGFGSGRFYEARGKFECSNANEQVGGRPGATAGNG
jgi:hypothetical protein